MSKEILVVGGDHLTGIFYGDKKEGLARVVS
jgi:hypothetical protein